MSSPISGLQPRSHPGHLPRRYGIQGYWVLPGGLGLEEQVRLPGQGQVWLFSLQRKTQCFTLEEFPSKQCATVPAGVPLHTPPVVLHVLVQKLAVALPTAMQSRPGWHAGKPLLHLLP